MPHEHKVSENSGYQDKATGVSYLLEVLTKKPPTEPFLHPISFAPKLTLANIQPESPHFTKL